MSDADLLRQAAEAAEAAFNAMMAVPGAEPFSALIIPPNVPEDVDPLILAIPVPPDTKFPLNDVAIARMQEVLDAGMAIYVLSTDKPTFNRFVALVRTLAQMVAPSGDVS